jgi:hypothetical protein
MLGNGIIQKGTIYMSKVYAVIHPAARYEGSITDVLSPFINLLSYLTQEHICGYPITSTITFVNSLEAAKNFIAPGKGTLNKDLLRERCQSAVLEFDADEYNITFLGKIHTVSKVEQTYGDTEYGRFEKVWVPAWQSRDISYDELSEHAETELMKKLQYERYIRTHAAELWKAVSVRPEEMKKILDSILLAGLSGMAASTGILVAESCPALAFLIAATGLLGTGYFAYTGIDQQMQVNQRRTDYMINNVFTHRPQQLEQAVENPSAGLTRK